MGTMYILLMNDIYYETLSKANSRHATVLLCCLPLILYKLKQTWVNKLKIYEELFHLIALILTYFTYKKI